MTSALFHATNNNIPFLTRGAMAVTTRLLHDENCELKRTKEQLACDLAEEKLLVRNLMGTIKNYEKILRLEGSPSFSERTTGDLVMDKRLKQPDTWGILYRSIVLLDEENSDMKRTVACMLEKVRKIEKLYQYREHKVSHLNKRLQRLEAIAFGQKTEC